MGQRFMDILTAVLEALQLRATRAQRVRLDDGHQERVESGHAVMIVVTEGRYTATAGAVEYDMAARDFLLVMAGQTVDLQRRSGAAQPLVRCDYTLRADLPHPLMRQLPPVLHFGARLLTDPAEFGRTIALLEAELANAPVGVEFVATRLAEIAFVEVLRKGVLAKAAEPAFLGALADAHVARASTRSTGRRTKLGRSSIWPPWRSCRALRSPNAFNASSASRRCATCVPGDS